MIVSIMFVPFIYTICIYIDPRWQFSRFLPYFLVNGVSNESIIKSVWNKNGYILYMFSFILYYIEYRRHLLCDTDEFIKAYLLCTQLYIYMYIYIFNLFVLILI